MVIRVKLKSQYVKDRANRAQSSLELVRLSKQEARLSYAEVPPIIEAYLKERLVLISTAKIHTSEARKQGRKQRERFFQVSP